jgi:hypothetical protein
MSTSTDAFAALVLKRTQLFSESQISQILTADRTDGTGIPGVIVRLGVAREDDFLKRIGEILGFPYLDLTDVRPTDQSSCPRRLPV